LISALLFVAMCVTSPVQAGEPPNKAGNTMSVAVLEFANASSEAGLESLGKGLQSMVTTDLSRVATLTIVERSRLQDIVAEQNLSSTGLIDKATAAKIGKLVGASHLLGGTYTVVGKTMRLDARLFSVKSGDVLLAEEMTGDKDAFFELEKSLVNKLIAALGVKLDPKERANIARIHTADFSAFQSFSQGVAQFDQKRYDDAMESLRAAMRIDGEFNLARVTLDEYEALVAKIRSKAQSIELSTRELEKLKKDQAFQRDSSIAQRLLDIANEAGPAKRHRRLAALAYLIGLYNPHGTNHGRISRFQEHFDGLIVRRRADGLARRYFTEAQAVFPDAPLFHFGSHPPDTLDDLEKRIEGTVKALKQGLEHNPQSKNQGLINNLGKADDFASLMAVDNRERVKLLELAANYLVQLKADDYTVSRMLKQVAEAHLAVGDIDAASGALARASTVMTRADDLKDLATEIEKLGKVSALLAKTDKKTELRELIAAEGRNLPDSRFAWFTERGAPSAKLLDELGDNREPKRWFSFADPYWIWSSEPAYLLMGEYVLQTGPRVDGLVSKDLRYYKSLKTSSKDVLVALGRGARTDFDVSFELAYKHSRDYWPKHAPREAKSSDDLVLDPGRPEATFVFGLYSIDTRSGEYNQELRKTLWPEPTQGFGIRFSESGVALVRLGEDAPAEDLRKSEMTIKVLDEEKKKVGGERTKVRIQVKGKSVTVTAGSTYKFTLPSEPNGFLGAHIRGVGFVELGDLQLR